MFYESNDKHFKIIPTEPAGERFMMPTSYGHIAKDNYSFIKMENQNGIIPYIKFNRFIPPSVTLLAAFFLKELTLLTVNFTRSTDTKREDWSTLADVKISLFEPSNFIVPSFTLER